MHSICLILIFLLIFYNIVSLISCHDYLCPHNLSDAPCLGRKDLFKQFGIDLSFVATRSGLTRWEEHKEKDEFADEEDSYDPDNPGDP